MKQLQELGKDDKVIIILDSIGNLASKKEVEDALDGKSVAEMCKMHPDCDQKELKQMISDCKKQMAGK
jgi:ribosomal 50S subunit-associated protein YjgA (DUF615 family)